MQLGGLRQDRLDWDGWNVAKALARQALGQSQKAIVPTAATGRYAASERGEAARDAVLIRSRLDAQA